MSSESKIITREQLCKILEDWQSGRVTAKQVHDWAQDRFWPGEVNYADWEDDANNSAAKEVLGDLDNLDMNLMTSEDIPIYLEFLQTPRGSFAQGYKKLEAALEAVDFKERQTRLKDDPLYEAFCKESGA
jgi:hypothetical protein